MPDSTGQSLDLESDEVDTDVLFTQAMAQTRMAVCLTDPRRDDNPIVYVNEAFKRLTGYAEPELIGRNCRLLQGPDTDPATIEVLRRAIETEEVIVVELLNYRRDGSEFWNALHLGPIYDSNGELELYFGSQWDLSDVHTARAGEHLARMFARELAHRMNNMFSVISGIVTMSARHEGVPRVARVINERIAALGRAYDDTLSRDTFESVELGRIVRLTLAPYRDRVPERIVVRGERVELRPTTVSLIGLVLHELAINATKHGALADGQGGHVELDWAFDGERALIVQWRESVGEDRRGNADGGAPLAERAAGAGRGIIDDLVHAAGGQLDTRWREEGLRVRMTLPMDTVVDRRGEENGTA